MADEEEKKWWLSKTMWGGAVEIVIGLLIALGVASESLKVEVGPIAEAIVGLIGAVLGALVVIDRIRNKYKRLTK